MNDTNDGSRDRRPTLAEMLNSSVPLGNGNSSPNAKRRMTMAEMLRQSPLMGNTVALPDAVESAQVAKALKEEPQEESNLPAEAPAAPVLSMLAVAEIPPAVESEPRCSTNRYNLYARIQGRWTWQCDIHASTHAEGMRQAIAWLKPEHDALPIRLEQDELSAV